MICTERFSAAAAAGPRALTNGRCTFFWELCTAARRLYIACSGYEIYRKQPLHLCRPDTFLSGSLVHSYARYSDTLLCWLNVSYILETMRIRNSCFNPHQLVIRMYSPYQSWCLFFDLSSYSFLRYLAIDIRFNNRLFNKRNPDFIVC